MKAIFNQTNKTITNRYLTTIKQQIKKDSYHWYKVMREGEYEYIHEFKERISEIMHLQKMHHQIIDSDKEPTTVKQASMAELHRLNITLSNYFDVAPDIIGHTYQRHQNQKQRQQQQKQITSFDITNLEGKPFWIWDKQEHLRLADTTNEQCCFNHIVGLPVKNIRYMITKRFSTIHFCL
jgi:hypothetical protein